MPAAIARASIDRRRKPKTVDGYRGLLEVHVLPAFGSRRVGSITYGDANRFVRSIEELGRKPGTVRNAFFVLKMVLDYAIRDGNIRTNPCADVDLPSPQSPEMLFLTGAQVRALATVIDERWAALNASRSRPSDPAPYGLLVETAAFTGLRAGELAALRLANLDLRAGTARVVSSVSIVRGRRVEGIPKTRAGRRTVVVNQALCERLRAHLGDRLVDGEALVFTEPNGTPLKFGSFTASASSRRCGRSCRSTSTGSASTTSATPTPPCSSSRAPTRMKWRSSWATPPYKSPSTGTAM